jgi:hypothetical protein
LIRSMLKPCSMSTRSERFIVNVTVPSIVHCGGSISITVAYVAYG